MRCILKPQSIILIKRNNMPYSSQAQKAFFHSDRAKKAGITPEMVAQMDKESKGRKLPKRSKRK